MTITNGKSDKTHTDRARALANELEELEWDEDSSVTIVDGPRQIRVKSPSHAEIHIDQEAKTKPGSEPPKSSIAAPVKGVGHILSQVKSWQHVIALALVLGFLAWALAQGFKLW